jgi:two-component system, chemotaxis family, chemotaxis protein CheY
MALPKGIADIARWHELDAASGRVRRFGLESYRVGLSVSGRAWLATEHNTSGPYASLAELLGCWSLCAEDLRPAPHPAAQGAAGAVLLAVDDDPIIRESIADIFSEEGYRVFTAKDGADALALLPAIARPRVVLLDLMMPVMNGWQFLERLRAEAAWSELPVIALSASQISAPPKGACSLLPKPFELPDLIRAVRAYGGAPS